MKNIILNTDSYKVSMWKQYPPNTKTVYSYIESRGNNKGYKSVIFLGIQAFIREYLTDPVTQDDVEFAKGMWEAHGMPFNYEGWSYIVKEHNGILPIQIDAVPEGMPINTNNVLVTIHNTDPKCFWLTTYLETALLRAIWYPTTVATMSRNAKKIIARYLAETGDIEGLPFKLHDFGARGVSSEESARLGGMAHLVNFMGSDTMSGVLGAYMYYDEPMAGFSIPAAEHSTITSWGKDDEKEAFKNMLTQFKDSPLIAVVSDSYDIFNAVSNIWGDELKADVEKFEGMLVIRPDSGDPVTVVTEIAKLLEKAFGCEVNQKGYKVLNNVRIIQGDGIDLDSIESILQSLKKEGFSADNIAFGMGGALLQGWTRDTFKFAMKCSAIEDTDGNWYDVFKDPITDKVKTSKKGRFAVEYMCGLGNCGYNTIPLDVHDGRNENILQPVWRNGEMLKTTTFSEIRERANKWFERIDQSYFEAKVWAENSV